MANEETVARIVDRIVAEQPAAVLFAGDLVYHPTDEDEPDEAEREEMRNFMTEINRAVALLRPLTQAGIPVYAVLGNHDYGMNYPDSLKNERLAEAVRRALEATGIRVLTNTAAELRLPAENGASPSADSSGLYLAGVAPRWPGKAAPSTTLAHLPDQAPRIILMHNPDSFPDFPPETAPFAVAGHTHGGQIRVPFTKRWAWTALVQDERVTADGWIRNYGQAGNHLYVNRAIDFSSFPVRINCRPELTIFTLGRPR